MLRKFLPPRGYRPVFAPIDELHDSIKDSSSHGSTALPSSSLPLVELHRFVSPSTTEEEEDDEDDVDDVDDVS